MLTSAIFETSSIATIIPLLDSFSESSRFINNQFILNTLDFFNIEGETQILIFIILIFCILNIISSIVSVINIKVNYRFSSLISHDVCKKIYKNILNTSYINKLKEIF